MQNILELNVCEIVDENKHLDLNFLQKNKKKPNSNILYLYFHFRNDLFFSDFFVRLARKDASASNLARWMCRISGLKLQQCDFKLFTRQNPRQRLRIESVGLFPRLAGDSGEEEDAVLRAELSLFHVDLISSSNSSRP